MKSLRTLIPLSLLIVISLFTLTYVGHYIFLTVKRLYWSDICNDVYVKKEQKNSEGSPQNILWDSLYTLESVHEQKEEILNFALITEFVIDEIFQFNKDSLEPLTDNEYAEYKNFSDFYYSYFSGTTPSRIHRYIKNYEDREEYYFENSLYLNYDQIIQSLKQLIDDRSPENIRYVFDLSKYTVYNLIDKKTYEKTKLNLYVNYLIETYNSISIVEGYEEYLSHLYYLMSDEESYYYPTDTCPEIQPILNKKLYKLATSDDSPFEMFDLMWLHTFWVRRYKDGNMEEVYLILQEIRNHYSSLKL